jgi:hypothetical protein
MLERIKHGYSLMEYMRYRRVTNICNRLIRYAEREKNKNKKYCYELWEDKLTIYNKKL